MGITGEKAAQKSVEITTLQKIIAGLGTISKTVLEGEGELTIVRVESREDVSLIRDKVYDFEGGDKHTDDEGFTTSRSLLDGAQFVLPDGRLAVGDQSERYTDEILSEKAVA